MFDNSNSKIQKGKKVVQEVSSQVLTDESYCVSSLEHLKISPNITQEDQILCDERAAMIRLGLPVEFKSSKKPFYPEDSDSSHDRMEIERPRKRKCNRPKKHLKKYWMSRFQLFSLFSKGIMMDNESWYSVTPEAIAKHIAEKCIQSGARTVLDPFCGVGSNAIQFALASPDVLVIASDICPSKVAMAKNNAKIYGVQDRIIFMTSDFFHMLKNIRLNIECVFLSPPWGGPDYISAEKYSLSMMNPNGFDIFNFVKKTFTKHIAYFLPRNVDRDELNCFLEPGEVVDVEENILNGRTKTVTAYFGNLVRHDAQD